MKKNLHEKRKSFSPFMLPLITQKIRGSKNKNGVFYIDKKLYLAKVDGEFFEYCTELYSENFAGVFDKNFDFENFIESVNQVIENA